jgi:hypothetical protein
MAEEISCGLFSDRCYGGNGTGKEHEQGEGKNETGVEAQGGSGGSISELGARFAYPRTRTCRLKTPGAADVRQSDSCTHGVRQIVAAAR